MMASSGQRGMSGCEPGMSQALSGGLGALLSAATGGHLQQSGGYDDDEDDDDEDDDDDADDAVSPVRDRDTSGKRRHGPGGGFAVKAVSSGDPVTEVEFGTPYTGQHGGPPPFIGWSGPAAWQASIQAKRELLAEMRSPGDVVSGVHREGPPLEADPRMNGWGQPMPDMLSYPPPGTHGPQMSQMEMQQYWRMQQLAAANTAGYNKPGTGLVAATSTAAAIAGEGESAQSSDAEGVPADDVSRLRRRASLVDGAQVLAGMRIGIGTASAFYDGKTTDTPMVSPTEEDTEDEEDEEDNEDLPKPITKASTAKSKGRAAARVTGGRSPRTARKPTSSRSKTGGSKPARGGKSSSSSSAAAAAAAAAVAATSTVAATSKATKAEPSPASAAGKNSRAKETHRQAEQRRRGEQIKAVMELKAELDLHEGTPLGETLIQAAEHIRALQQNEHKLLAQIQSMKKSK